MRVVIVAPRQSRATGNHISAERHRQGLTALGHEVALLEADPREAFPTLELNAFAPDIVHLLHAYRSGFPFLASGLPHPFVVTLTGTDIHQGIDDPVQGPVIREVLRRAAAVITQNALTFAALQRQSELAPRLHRLIPGIVLGDEPFSLRECFAITPNTTIFLHPAGIRPVKGNLELLLLLDPVAAKHPELRAVFCGPVLDTAYDNRFQAALQTRPWAIDTGAITAAAMPAVMRQSDVILNNSVCEGMPNALLEAAVLGRPILARDIPGNRAVVEHGANGLLYGDAETFWQHANALLDNSELRRRLSRPRPDLYRPKREALELADIFRQSLEVRPFFPWAKSAR
ncbi:MAG: glycosyltransferase [Desulfuromonadales bacterium]